MFKGVFDLRTADTLYLYRIYVVLVDLAKLERTAGKWMHLE